MSLVNTTILNKINITNHYIYPKKTEHKINVGVIILILCSVLLFKLYRKDYKWWHLFFIQVC